MSSENKRYYWLQLPEDFFNDKTVKKLRKIPGGDTYTIIALKIMLKALKDENKLYYDGIEDSFAEELALDIDEQDEAVEITLKYLIQSGWLVQESQDTIFSAKGAEMTGSETASTRRSRKHRALKDEQSSTLLESPDKLKALHCNTDATSMQRNCNGDIDIEKELDKEKEIEDSLEDNKLSSRSSSLAQTHSDVKKRKFTPPSLEELEAYIREEGITNVNPKKFYDHYSDPDRNWKLSNGKRMDNWKLTVRTWGRNAFGTGSPSSDNPLNLSEKEIAYAKWGAERDRILEEQGKKKAQEADYSDCPF